MEHPKHGHNNMGGSVSQVGALYVPKFPVTYSNTASEAAARIMFAVMIFSRQLTECIPPFGSLQAYAMDPKLDKMKPLTASHRLAVKKLLTPENIKAIGA